MKKIVNGQYINMTKEEIEKLPKSEALPQMPTESERLEALEMAMLEIAEVLANG